MCGIAGIIDLRGAREIDRAALSRMSAALVHRGPDGDGVHIAPGLGLAHRRLAIIDREGGAQPFAVQGGEGVLCYNGEIYNYRDLASAPPLAGLSLRTRSDTEVLAEGLAGAGEAYISSLRGVFAFAFWDARRQTLLLARDRLGEKPLYYAETPDGFLIFASEIGALAASGLIGRDLDHEATADYFLYGYVPDPKTIYAGVRKLRAGELLRARRGEPVALKRYWRPVFEPACEMAYDATAEALRARLDEAVSLQMVSDAPLGVFLSGGVDSSAVLAAMSQNMSRDGARIRVSTVGFSGDAHDERPYARAMAERCGAEQQETVVDLDAVSLIDRIAAVYGEPFADVSALPTYLVCEAARRRVTVALTGDGADEVFAGYRRYPFFLAEESVRARLPAGARRFVFGAAGAAYPKLDWAPRALRLKTTLQSLGEPRAAAYARAVGVNLPERVDAMLSADFKASLDGYSSVSVIDEAGSQETGADDPLSFAQAVDFETWLPGRMLVKIDRASMAHGLEARPPFLDPDLVEWAARLPGRFKLQNGTGKRILKTAMEGRLPKDILYRRKQGFTPPLKDWLRAKEGPLRRLRESSAWRDSGVLDHGAVESMAARHQTGVSDYSQELWTVIMFDAFLRQSACG